MNMPKNETNIGLKRIKPRYIMIRENIHAALDIYTLSLYMAFRYESDYDQADSVIKRSAKFLYEKAKISRRQFFKSLNILEGFGLVLRDSSSELNSVSIYHIAQELYYFNTDCGVVHDVHGVVHGVHTYHYSFHNNIISESDDSPAAIKVSKKKPLIELSELIDVYRTVFPNNPQPHSRLISTSLKKTLSALVKRWPELDPNHNQITVDAFRRYLELLRDTAPKFALGEYTTEHGRKKKNNLETFCRWNTIVKFLENQYS